MSRHDTDQMNHGHCEQHARVLVTCIHQTVQAHTVLRTLSNTTGVVLVDVYSVRGDQGAVEAVRLREKKYGGLI